MMRTCRVCGKTESEVVFYDWLNNVCRADHLNERREYTKNNKEMFRKYDANRYQNDPRVRERHKRYRKTPAGKASVAASQKRWLDANPEKRAAHVILGHRIRDGHVLKPDTCEHCGLKSERIEGHHEDYAKPLEVVWLCSMCHVKIHKKEIE